MNANSASSGFKLAVQPMVHVQSMAETLAFLEGLGAQLLYGSRDGDWSLLKFGATTLSVLARPPSEMNPEPVELQFVSATPLEAIEASVRATMPAAVVRGVADEAFGRMLILKMPDGLVVKLLELERDLIADRA